MVRGGKKPTLGKAESSSVIKGKERFDPITPKKESSKKEERQSDIESEVDEKLSGYSIYIFNLSPDATNNDLWRLFAPFGSIKSVAVMKDGDSKFNKGYAFVTMKNLDEASQAIEILNGQSMDGRPLRISFKGKKMESDDALGEIGSYPLYVYNLAPECDEDSLWKLFTQFGAVKNVSIVKDSKTNVSKGYAFITMRNVDDAKVAIRTLNGFVLDSRQLSVSFKNKKLDKDQNNDDITENKMGEYHIYVNNLLPDAEDSVLWKLFAQFGAIKDVTIVKDPQTKKCLGYGFVTMKNFEEANLAINTLNDSKLDDRTIHVSFKTKKALNKRELIQL
ncbi:ELAV-like protein 2 [Condylostylus longicornis]|uniref:ELAV-like protein 2 n=1 Tax=Condylostylus longicornis TaxID=2530218 RepID=UPI00244DFBEA|nr:ELAV-like protein 2 [Condylostylus longicornis]